MVTLGGRAGIAGAAIDPAGDAVQQCHGARMGMDIDPATVIPRLPDDGANTWG